METGVTARHYYSEGVESVLDKEVFLQRILLIRIRFLRIDVDKKSFGGAGVPAIDSSCTLRKRRAETPTPLQDFLFYNLQFWMVNRHQGKKQAQT